MPLPDLFKIDDAPKINSNWIYTKQNVNPHSQAYTILQNNIINNDDFYASIVTTRYHRSYDGSFHLTFKVDKISQRFGVLIRYIDRFSHVALDFDFLAKKIILIRRSPYKG